MARVPDNVLARMRGSHMLGVFVRVDTDDPLGVWLGIADIPAKIDDVDIDGMIYRGGGRLANVPDLEATVNGIAEYAEFTLSGIAPDQLGPWSAEALHEMVKGRAVHVGVTTLDDYYQPMSSIIPLLKGKAQRVSEYWPPVTGTQNPTITLGLGVGFGLTTRDRPAASLWSEPHHRADHPTDAFCDETARLAKGVQPDWPRW